MKLIVFLFLINVLYNKLNCPAYHIFNTIKEYPYESHLITTIDNYGLGVFRIQKKNTKIKSGLKPILLVHGVADSSDNFLLNKENSIALYLADKNYDIWLINNRGNKYSRINETLDLHSRKFWNYSFQEMGKYDIPATIDYILNITKFKKLTIIGHSQGTTQIFANLSENISNDKIDKFIAIAPIIYLVN